MTNSNDRLDRIEAILEATAQKQRETESIVQSNSRLLQAMLEQQATDRLKREEEKAEHEQRIRLLEETQRDLVQTSSGIARLLTSMDEDRPTILRRLMAIEDKVDTLIERNQ